MMAAVWLSELRDLYLRCVDVVVTSGDLVDLSVACVLDG